MPFITSDIVMNGIPTTTVSGVVTTNGLTNTELRATPVTVSGIISNAPTVNLPSYQVDAFGRIRTSNSHILGSLMQIYDNNPLLIDTMASGVNATTTWSGNRASTLMTTGTNTPNRIIRQSKRYYTYVTAHGQLIVLTFARMESQNSVIKRVGYFDDNNGLFLEATESDHAVVVRSNVTGTPVDNRIVQTSWNIDPLNGLGPSGKTIDWSKVQILEISFQWLGVGAILFSFVIDGIPYPVHLQKHSNLITSVYMSTPNLPIRYEVYLTGNVTGGNQGVLEQICASIQREGGDTEKGVALSVSSDIGAPVTATTTPRSSLSLRLRPGYTRARFEPLSVDISNNGSNLIEWKLILNPTLGGALSYANTGNILQSSITQQNYTAGTGVVLDGGFVNSTASSKSTSTAEINNYLAIVSSILDVSDVLSVILTAITGTQNCYVAINGCERML